ncbi:transcription initiation factor TFIID subunit 2 [[Candida] jaroonii]|uniref:Transcription initiation factor TFIID subunit 2 n=1 Tax=[Candida] jaroonii TaxID=467808 RepID=A0ACA9Y230_9ASCO|nr:transcription initiation factor TFIID subunit 2 [[Candida] jaroonii]
MPPVAMNLDLHSGLSTNTSQAFTPRTYKASKGRNINLSTQNLKIGHQRVNIDVDLPNNTIDGLTEITVIPTSSHLRSIKLDCREMQIKEILVNNRKANFIHKDLLYINDDTIFEDSIEKKVINLFDLYNKDLTIHQHHLLRQKIDYIFGEVNEDPRQEKHELHHGNTEELTIILPDNLKLHLTDRNSFNTPSSQPNTVTPMHLKSRNTHTDYYTPIQVIIEYEVKNPKNGINFITDSEVKTNWHAYTVNSEYNISSSSWVPCIDNLWEKNTWTIEVNTPRTVKDIGHPIIIGTKEAIESRKLEYKRRRREEKLKRRDDAKQKGETVAPEDESSDDDDYDDDDDESQDLMVATGDFVDTKEVPHPTDLSKKTVSWSIYNPVCAHHVGWTIGCFQPVDLPEFVEEQDDNDMAEETNEEVSCPVKVYCTPDQIDMAKNTCIATKMAIKYFSKEFGSFPFNSYTMIFVKDNLYPIGNFAGITIFDSKLLYPSNLIEPAYTITPLVINAIASQWSGINITPQQFNDLWCTIAIAGFMTYQFLKVLMGANETRFRIKKDIDKCVQLDVGKKPVAQWFFRFPISENDLDFIKLKSPLILNILDKTMTKSDKSFGLHRVLPKLFLQAMSGELVNNTLSTQHFQYVCEKVNRNRLETFFKQWIFGAGCPTFNVSQRFNRKRGMIEVAVRQVQIQEAKNHVPNLDNFVDSSVALLDDEPKFPVQPAFIGPLTIRVHEADGTPYEHVVDLKESYVKIDINYNSKFRRMKKHKEEAAEGGTYSRFGDIIQSDSELTSWKLVEWAPIDDEELYNNAFEWIRVDTDFEWIAKINVGQPDYMFTSQLQYDRDVEAQFEAVNFFGRSKNPIIPYCTTLIRTIMDSRYYYGVRIGAAQALASFSRPENNFIGLPYLIRVYQKLFCFPNSTIPLANDFSDLPSFLIQKSFANIFASIRDDEGHVPAAAKDVILNMVIYNENSNNMFQDSLYISSMIESLTDSIISKEATPVNNVKINPEDEIEDDEDSEHEFNKLVVSEIERQQKLDEWVPSYHHIISTTCLKQRVRLAFFGITDLPLEELIFLSSNKYHPNIRLQAFKGLLILGGLKNVSIMKYYLKTCLFTFENHSFRSKLIEILVEAIKIAAIQGTCSTLDDEEFKTLEKLLDIRPVDGDIISIGGRRDLLARTSFKGTIQLLRRNFGIGKGLQYVMWELLHSSLLSLYNRRLLFTISQILYKEIDSLIVDLPIPSVETKDLTKKIVLKYLGDGKIVIKRQGRFKIQLHPKIILNKPKLKVKLNNTQPEPPRPMRAPAMRAPTVKVPAAKSPVKPPPVKPAKEVAPPPPPPVQTSLVTKTGTTVKFTLGRRNLKGIVAKDPIRSTFTVGSNGVVVNGTFVTIPIVDKPHRFVRILLKQKKVMISKDPFKDTMATSADDSVVKPETSKNSEPLKETKKPEPVDTELPEESNPPTNGKHNLDIEEKSDIKRIKINVPKSEPSNEPDEPENPPKPKIKLKLSLKRS